MEIPEVGLHKPAVSRTEQEEARGTEPDGRDHLASTLGNAGVARVLGSRGVQRSGGTRTDLDESVARAIEQRRGGGAPLSGGVRDEMEGAFGRDLSDVRIHTDPEADELNRSVKARAFTVGTDIFFKQGTFDSGSSAGKRLLAHELTHVVQQGDGAGRPTTVSDPGDASERQADAVAEHVTSASDTSVTAGSSVARQAPEEDEDLKASADLDRQDEAEELERSAAVDRAADEEDEDLAAASDVAREDAEEPEEDLGRTTEVHREAPEEMEEDAEASP